MSPKNTLTRHACLPNLWCDLGRQQNAIEWNSAEAADLCHLLRRAAMEDREDRLFLLDKGGTPIPERNPLSIEDFDNFLKSDTGGAHLFGAYPGPIPFDQEGGQLNGCRGVS